MRRSARPYAEALRAVAGSPEVAAAVRDELRAFSRLMSEVPALGKMAVNPAIPLEVKERVLEAVVEKAGLSSLAHRLLRALLTRYRLGRLGEIVDGISERLNRELGVAVAEVRSARPLAEEERDRLRGVLAAKLARQVELREAVDPDLLAGFVVRIGSDYYDASVRGQLERLTAEMARA